MEDAPAAGPSTVVRNLTNIFTFYFFFQLDLTFLANTLTSFGCY